MVRSVIVWLLALDDGTTLERIVVPTPAWVEIVPESRVRLLVTTGPQGARVTTTVLEDCAEVRAVEPGALTIAVSVDQRDELSVLTPDARVTPALCPSDASALTRGIPAGHVALPLPRGTPGPFLSLLWAGDRVDVLVSLSHGPDNESAETTTILRGLTLAAHGGVALYVPVEGAQRYANAVDAGTVAISLQGASKGPGGTPEVLSSILPTDRRVVAGFDDRFGVFAARGELVDVIISAPPTTKPLFQAVFTIDLGVDRLTTQGVVGLVLMGKEAEMWQHLHTFLPFVLALRRPDDEDFTSYDAAPEPEPPPVAAPNPAARIARGMRGLILPVPRDTREGARVDVTTATDSGVRVLAASRVVLSVRQAYDGTTLALLHVTPPDVIAVAAALGERRSIAIR